MKKNAFVGLFILALAMLAGACGGPVGRAGTGEAEPVAASSDPLTGASVVATADLPATGVVRILSDTAGGCTGVLLTNRWVLTAAHCFCTANVNTPSNTVVSIYGSEANGQNQSLVPLYQTTATRIQRNANNDVALVKLAQTLPFKSPPQIYTGNGSDLLGQTVTQWGWGNQISLRTTTSSVVNVTRDFGSFGSPHCANESFHGGDGLLLQPVHGEEGDSGGPVFSSSGQLVGVYSGVDSDGIPPGPVTNYDGYTGIWLVRDWIKQITVWDIATASNCVIPLPISTGFQTRNPAVAEGADGAVHIASPQADGSIGHWRIDLGGVHTLGAVPGASTNPSDAVGMGLESSGNPPMLGLAYRDSSSGELMYARWSDTGGWSAPIARPSTPLAAGPAMTKGGPVALMQSNRRVYVTFFDPVSQSFGGLSRPPVSQWPLADPNQRISVAFEPAYGGITTVGYRTPSGNWIQATGSQACSTYFCGANPAFSNSWSSAMLAYGSGDRMSIVTTVSAGVFNRVSFGTTYYPWTQQATQAVGGQPGVAEIGGNLAWVGDYFIQGGLFYGRADNCFANDF
jgi:V8-like Glu-specific endopeptidase